MIELRRKRTVTCRVCKYQIRPSSRCVYVLVGDQRHYGCLRCDETGAFDGYRSALLLEGRSHSAPVRPFYLPALLLLSACAGDPFVLFELPDASPATVTQAKPDADTYTDAPASALADASTDAPADAQSEASWPEASAEASRIDAGAPETGPWPEASTPEEASVPEASWTPPEASAADVCTPYPAPITWAGSCDGTMATVPAHFFMVQSGPCVSPTSVETSGGLLATATPKACQCEQSYTCACLDEQGVCGAGKHAATCQPSQNANSEIIVNCN